MGSRKGSAMVEAAIIMPIFIVAVVTLTYLIKVLWIQENVFHDLVNESRKLSIECYIYTAAQGNGEALEDLAASGTIDRFLLESRMSQVVKNYKFQEIEGYGIKEFHYGGSDGEGSGEVKVVYGYEVYLPLPFPFVKEISIENSTFFHGWTGKSMEGNPMPFSQMGQVEDSRLVYIFPKAGARYHVKSCRYVSVYPVRVSLSQSIRKQYSGCSLCDSGNMNLGATVFIFSDGGKVFHRGNCTAVDKYVITMEQKDAELKGYRACSVCGG